LPIEDDAGWGRYLRIRVVINLYQPLERGRSLILSGNSCWVPFKFEKLPAFCFKCERILHEISGSPVSVPKKANHKEGALGWGSWIRADDLSKAPDHHLDGSQNDNHPFPAASNGGLRSTSTNGRGSQPQSGKMPNEVNSSPEGKNRCMIDGKSRDRIPEFIMQEEPTATAHKKKIRDNKGVRNGGSKKGNLGRADQGPVIKSFVMTGPVYRPKTSTQRREAPDGHIETDSDPRGSSTGHANNTLTNALEKGGKTDSVLKPSSLGDSKTSVQVTPNPDPHRSG
jgi:hypothetical protein